MRTTINLPDALLQAAKQRAAQQERTLTSLIEQGLRQVLADDAVAEVPVLPTWGSGRGKVLVDLGDADAVWAVLDAPDDERPAAGGGPERNRSADARTPGP